MRSLDSAVLTAIQANRVVARDLLWITAKNRSTGNPVDYGFWNDLGTLTQNVIDGRTGSTVSRQFYGVAFALNVGRIPLVADITVRDIEIEIPYLDATVADMVRTNDVRSAPMQLYRLYLDPDTRVALASARARFVGYVDTLPIETPAEGSEGSIKLVCVSTTRELTRKNFDVRSHESQQARSGGDDDFYKYTAVINERDLFWGRNRSAPATKTHTTFGDPSPGGA